LNDCCPWVTSERVRAWLYHIRMARLSHYDPVEAACSYGTPRRERFMGRVQPHPFGVNDEESEVIAVLEALPKHCTVQQLQILHADPTELMKRLCPHSVAHRAILTAGQHA
jgi:hypothetical protein